MPSLIDKSGNMDYYGPVTFGNFIDWLITLLAGGIIALFTMHLGGARTEVHVVLLPLFSLLLVLHGLWLAVDQESPKRLSLTPLYFVPFALWAVASIFYLSPVQWLGQIELIYGLEIFILLWVLVNNVRTRVHLWVLIVLVFSPIAYAILIGFYQYFQNPNKMAGALTEYAVGLSPEYLGHATGSFADPDSFAVLLLIGLPSLLISVAVPRLALILRVFCGYIALMFLCSLVLTQRFWPLVGVSFVVCLVPVFCTRKLMRRIFVPLITLGVLLTFVVLGTWLHPKYAASFSDALSSEGEAIRLDLWSASASLVGESPLIGYGGGSAGMVFAQNSQEVFARMPQTPHNDFLWVLIQYGAVGLVLLALPVFWVLWSGLRSWKREPDRLRLKGQTGVTMPPRKYFIAVGMASVGTFAVCALCTFIFPVTALVFYGVLFFAMLVKSIGRRRLKLPESKPVRMLYALLGLALGVVLYTSAFPRLQSHALAYQARERLDYIVEQRVHTSGNTVLLEEVITMYEEAVVYEPKNADAWIGLSAANCQRYFQSPAEFELISRSAMDAAVRATELSEGYGLAWAQLGVSYALGGHVEQAEDALLRALKLAPNNSHMHYCWAAFMSSRPEGLGDALASVVRALEIDPDNMAARRLQQKLLML